MTHDVRELVNQVETVRHYLHSQIGKPLKPELASAPEIALDLLKDMIIERLSEINSRLVSEEEG